MLQMLKGPLCCFCLLVSAVSLYSQASTGYFPKSAFSSGHGDGEFVPRWFSGQLRAMHEPSLLTSRKAARPVYRFLLLPSFSEPLSVRVTVHPDHTADVTTVKGHWAGGYKPKRTYDKHQSHLSQAEVEQLLSVIETQHFWSLPTEPANPENGCDGTEWVMEGTSQGKYHVVDRWEGASLTQLGRYMIGEVASLKKAAAHMSATVPADR